MNSASRHATMLLGSQLPLAACAALDGPAAALSLALWGGLQVRMLAGLLRPKDRLFGPNLTQTSHQPRVALTFDDGPHATDTPALLSILGASRVRATFFFVAERARRHPGLVRRAALEGHEVQPHSDSHPWWFSLAWPGRLRREVLGAAASIQELSGSPPRWFRPPMGHKNIFLRDLLAEAGLRQVTWSVRSYDTVRWDSGRIRRAVLRGARGGGIILLHEGARRRPGSPSATVAALPGILEDLRRRGLEPVSLGDLLRDAGPERTPSRADPSSRAPGAGAG